MDAIIEIRQLDQILQPFLLKNDTKMLRYTVKRLTAAGDNYGSLMLQVEVILENRDVLNLVAKLCPQNEWIKEIFNIPISFKKEIAMYQIIFPILESIQHENNVDTIINCIPECYGARISLNPVSDVVDDDALLLLENLKFEGYKIMDRMNGFDLVTIKLVMTNLAVFHATPIAVKLSHPDVFKKQILPHLQRQCMYDKISKETKQELVENIIETAGTNENCNPLLPKVRLALIDAFERASSLPEPKEPFATINHCDLWINNVMIKMEGNESLKCKIVDFQLIEYGSPGNDIVFLLFGSLKKEMADLHYGDLIKLYYDTFIKTLRDLKCDITPFTFKSLEEEINTSARSIQFLHTMLMLKPIFMAKEAAMEVHELSEEEMVKEDFVTDEYKQRVPELIIQFAQRGWL